MLNLLCKVPENIYIDPSFKFFFIKEFNKICDKSKNKNPPLGVVLAEAFAIVLNLMNEEQAVNDTIITAETKNG